MDKTRSTLALLAVWGMGCGSGTAASGATGTMTGAAGTTSGATETLSPTEGLTPAGSDQEGDDAGDAALSGTLAGQVTLLGAASNQGVQVTVAPWHLGSVTDVNGSYLISDVPAGNYSITFSAGGYLPQTITGQLALGEPGTVSVTLTKSQLITPIESLDGGGVWLGAKRWMAGPDGGQVAGAPLFFGDATSVALVAPDGGVLPLFSSDGGYRQVGFTTDGQVVVESADPDTGFATIAFLSAQGVDAIALGTQAEWLNTLGDAAFFGTYQGGGVMNYGAVRRGDLAPRSVASQIRSFSTSVVAVGDAWVGWQLGPSYSYALTAFGVDAFQSAAPANSSTDRALTASLDGTAAAGMYERADGGEWGFTATNVLLVSPSDAGSGPISVVADLVATVPTSSVYPLGGDSYLAIGDPSAGVQPLTVVEAGNVNWAGSALNWAPMHGTAVLATVASDGGSPVLEVIGASGVTSGGPSGGIPFADTWAPPQFSDDNRFVIVPGVASIFDMKNGTETPLSMDPVSAQFDHAEARVLLVDAAGNMAMVQLSAVNGAPLQATPLEGTAINAAFSSDEASVVYAGTDALGNVGLFLQPCPF